MFVSASHELSQEYREFERSSTVAANAYIGPKVRRYIGEIDSHMRKAGFAGSFLVVQSTGGLYKSEPGAERMRADAGIAGRPPASSARRRCAARSKSTMPLPSTWAAQPRKRA